MRILHLGLLLFACLLLSCKDNTEQQGNKAFNKGQYYKALELYKQSLKKHPARDRLYSKFTDTLLHICHQGFSMVKQQQYRQAIEHLRPLLNEPENCPADAYVLTVISYFYGYADDPSKIRKGLAILNQALRNSSTRFRVRGLPKSLQDWLVAQGIKLQEINSTGFRKEDAGAVYRAFFFHNLARQIIRQAAVPSFPLPPKWEIGEKELLLQAYTLFAWMVHNVKIIPANHQFYYPALLADVILRGYGTREECSSAFANLCLQFNISAYLLTPRREQNGKLQELPMLVLVRTGRRYVIFDLSKGVPLIDKATNMPIEMQSLFIRDQAAKISFATPDLQATDLRQSIIGVVIPPRSLFPRLSLLRMVFSKTTANLISPPPYFFLNPHDLADYPKKEILRDKTIPYDYLQPKPKGCCIVFYPKLFKVWHDFNTDPTQQQLHQTRNKILWFIEARLAELHGDKQAATLYAKILPQASASWYEQLARYLYIGCLLDQADPTTAEKKALEYLSQYPDSEWRGLLYCRLARQAAIRGNSDQAKKYYLQSDRLAADAIPYLVKLRKFVQKQP